ncbi:MAG: SIMPL domain-containing protein [Zhengella sp.]|uniref:SIMPL domain-containing protein n=1 Tax=Zhengella sp. TaxID=2282762 RepID=UPI001E18C02E|nr:SIMPL domain-containing protein [Notoacmeibacter sp.]MCC0028621.1 SIMPL domain-containing protein [Brucellaceae bacterium]
MPLPASRRLALALAAGLFLAAPASAMADEPVPRIAVTGQGEVSLAPDMATVSMTVLREADTARAALDANNEAMAAVIEAMREEGIEDRDLQTSGFSIQPRYVLPRASGNGDSPKIIGYQVSNTLTVRIRAMARLGAILDKSVSLGVNQGGSVSFSNADPQAALTEARRKAVENAIEKARTLADAAGVSVGAILEMSELASRPYPRPLMAAMAMRSEAADAVPLAGGENTYTVDVNVTFAIGK